jgi:hypothetical protein
MAHCLPTREEELREKQRLEEALREAGVVDEARGGDKITRSPVRAVMEPGSHTAQLLTPGTARGVARSPLPRVIEPSARAGDKIARSPVRTVMSPPIPPPSPSPARAVTKQHLEHRKLFYAPYKGLGGGGEGGVAGRKVMGIVDSRRREQAAAGRAAAGRGAGRLYKNQDIHPDAEERRFTRTSSTMRFIMGV